MPTSSLIKNTNVLLLLLLLSAVSPDRALYLPTFSHFVIVNKTSLSLSLSLLLLHTRYSHVLFPLLLSSDTSLCTCPLWQNMIPNKLSDRTVVMRSPCAGAALYPPFWIVPSKALSLSVKVSLSLRLRHGHGTRYGKLETSKLPVYF